MPEERPVNPVLTAIIRNSDVILAISVIVILTLMVIPLPRDRYWKSERLLYERAHLQS